MGWSNGWRFCKIQRGPPSVVGVFSEADWNKDFKASSLPGRRPQWVSASSPQIACHPHRTGPGRAWGWHWGSGRHTPRASVETEWTLSVTPSFPAHRHATLDSPSKPLWTLISYQVCCEVSWKTVCVSPDRLCVCSVTQLCPTLCNRMDCSPPGSFVRGSSQVRILEWVAISFSRGTSQPGDQTRVYCIAGGFFTTEPSGKPLKDNRCSINIHLFLKKVEMTQAACPDGETGTRA